MDNQANERTALLKSHAPSTPTKHPSSKEVHYRNIEGNRFWWLFGSIIFGNTIAFFDSTVMASSHPVITSYFHASNSASWLSTVFYLTSTVFQPVYGRVSDVVGRRSVFLFATVIFLLSTAWCALAGDIGSFIAARAVCGLGAGGCMAMSAIITSDIVKIEYRGIYQSYYNMAYGLGNGLGAALGGLLCDKLGWRAAFGIQLPFIIVFMLMIFWLCPRNLGPTLAKSQGQTLPEAFKSFDTTGALMLTITVTALILGINLGGNVLSWTHPIVLTSLALAVFGVVSLVRTESRATHPILPIPYLSTIPFGNLMWGSFLSSVITNTVLFNVPLYLQAVRQTTPTTSGLMLISSVIGVSLSAVFSGYYITRTRRMKPMLNLGVVCIFAGAITATSLAPHLPLWSTLFLIPWASIGQGFSFPATTIAVLALATDPAVDTPQPSVSASKSKATSASSSTPLRKKKRDKSDQTAVVITTLGLLRSLGAIHGVALSSWILQNALPFYLYRHVTDTSSPSPTKGQIIDAVRRSVHAIASLPEPQKTQVREAYAMALRITFAMGIVVAIVVLLLVVPVGVGRLRRQDQIDRDVATAAATEAIGDGEGGAGNLEGGGGGGGSVGAIRAADDEEAVFDGSEDGDGDDEDEETIADLEDRNNALSRYSSRAHEEAVQTGRRASFDTTF